ncbi:MAG: RHS repeat-associated core domain-containing protein, partial [Bacteroidota bacterium]|nr:RHS repeat-associated core domain-containing protein [Bacteroidota bacterium]
MKKICFSVLLILILIAGFGQKEVPEVTGTSFIFDKKLPGYISYNYKASEFVKFKDRFGYNPTVENSFHAVTDPLMVVPPEIDTTIGPPGNNNGGVVGTIDGTFSISEGGSATYNIPMDFPSGVNGLTPNLSFAYSSSGGDGLICEGWSLQGLSVISRYPKTYYYNDTAKAVVFSNYDEFVLNGQHLIKINNNEYRTENESFNKILPIEGDVNNGFIVYHSNGMITKYGTGQNSRQLLQNCPYPIAWYADTIFDSFMNYIAIEYFNDVNSGYLCPKYINYSGNIVTGTNPFYRIELLYEDKTNAPKIYFFNENPLYYGKFSQQKKRLTSVRCVYLPTMEIISRYQLNYKQEGIFNKYFLTSITQFDSDRNYFNPTIFEWIHSGHEVSQLGNASGTLNEEVKESTVYFSSDFNQDGTDDLIHYWRDFDYEKDSFSIHLGVDGFGFFSSNADFLFGFDFPVVTFQTGDFNGDGIKEIFYVYFQDYKFKSKIMFLDFNESTQSFTYTDIDVMTPLPSSVYVNPSFILGDFTGNGIMDCAVLYEPSGGSYTKMFFFTGTLNNPLSQFVSEGANQTYKWKQFFARDYDGDHKTDLLIITEYNAKVFKLTNDNQMITSYSCPDIFVGVNGKIASGDFNKDGKSDIIILTNDKYNNVKVYHSFGLGFIAAPVQTINNVLTGVGKPEIIDLNGDGYEDLAMIKIFNDPSNEANKKFIRIDYLSSTNGYSFLPGDTLILDHNATTYGGITNINLLKYTWCESFNSSMIDMVVTHFDPDLYEGYFIFSDDSNYNYNVISKITNGFGTEIRIYYDQIDNYEYYEKGREESYPVWMLSRGVTVVKNYEMETGNNRNNYTTEVKYKGAKYHRFGKGFLGFDEVTFKNESNGKTTTTYYSHNNPYYHVQIDSIKNWLTSTNSLINQITNSYQFHDFGNKRYYQYLSSSINEEFGLDGQLIDYSLQTNAHHLNPQGLPYRIEKNSRKTIDNEWVNKYLDIGLMNLTNESKWILGLQDTIRTTHTSYDEDPINRITTKEYYSQTGALKKSVIEPANPMKKEISYKYDDYGNITETKLSSNGPNDRITIKNFSEDGRFLEQVINPLGHSINYQYYHTTGLIKKQIDSNQNETTFFYDSFGQRVTTIYPDGKQTHSRLLWAQGHQDVPLLACYYLWEKTSGSPENLVFYDKMNRELRNVSIGFDGRKIYTDKQYYFYNNKTGLVDWVSNPYFPGTQTYYTFYTYDSLQRKSTVTSPDGVVTSFNYEKKQVTTTIVAGDETRIKMNKLDAGGRIVCSQDLVNNISVFNNYYSNGLLKETWTDADENSKISYFYDIFGNLDTIIDPNMGMTVKTYNVFGEIISETDSNNHTSVFEYDLLGRLTTRFEDDANTVWHYDTQQFGTGKIHFSTCTFENENGEITIIKDEYFYDSFGRKIRSEKTINGEVFVTKNTRDILGRIKYTTYPSGYTTMNHYNRNGYLGKISNPDAGILWEVNLMNSAGKIEEMTIGGDIHINYTYQNDNYRITAIETGKNSRHNLQNLHYHWFDIGNLDYRQDQNKNLTENFIYDNFDRLRYSFVNNIQQQEQQYFNNGNIDYKDDVGIYQYDPSGTKPYAVSSITEPVPEMLDLPDQSITYSSFRKVTCITQGNQTVSFAYGSDHSRVIQKTDFGGGNQTIKTYVGAMYEKIENSDGTIKKLHYLSSPAGVFAILTIDENGIETISYLLKDHIGSITAVLDKNGNILEEMNFDAWGRRRNPQDWSYNIVPETYLFDRGYTGHEHLDNFGLINMNGRIFDPVVARFLSPDPIIQDMENSQNYNGYSYCLNNPLRYTDPSGYSLESIIEEFLTIISIPARILSAGNAWLNDKINGRTNPYGYYTVDYIVHGIFPGPGNTCYLPNKGTEFSHLSWPRGVYGDVPGDGEEFMGGGSRTPFLEYRKKNKKVVEKKVEQGDFNNFDLFDFYVSSFETPGMSFNVQIHPDIDGEETEE